MGNRIILIASTASFLALAGAAMAQPVANAGVGPVPPPAYVYYVVPCNTPGAIVAGSLDVAGPPVCIVPVSAAPQVSPRYYRYYNPYWPGHYHPSFGFSLHGGGHGFGGLHGGDHGD